jgi:cytochrome oxidase Cu insertion factor (SCO1/SenC/PrrC family)
MIHTTQSGEHWECLPQLLLWGLLGVILVAVVGLGVWSLAWQGPLQYLFPGASSAQLPVYGSVPDFTLIDQRGRPVQRGDLEGKVWLVSFIFTNCPDECPLMTAEMARLQSDLAHLDDLRFVSISVDPDHDTPAVLSQYAERFNADPNRWSFLTGDKRAIYRLAKEGFRLGIVDPTEQFRVPPVEGSTLGGSESSLERPATIVGGQASGWLQHLRDGFRLVEPTAAVADHGRANDVLHSTRFVLVDRQVRIRGYYDSREAEALQRLRQHLQVLFGLFGEG